MNTLRDLLGGICTVLAVDGLLECVSGLWASRKYLQMPSSDVHQESSWSAAEFANIKGLVV